VKICKRNKNALPILDTRIRKRTEKALTKKQNHVNLAPEKKNRSYFKNCQGLGNSKQLTFCGVPTRLSFALCRNEMLKFRSCKNEQGGIKNDGDSCVAFMNDIMQNTELESA
jgi:hypothetical protein